MAAGQPYTASIFDRFLIDLVANDTLLSLYAPGGPWPEQPRNDGFRPVVRWWKQSAGDDTLRQDGAGGRAQSNPRYVICVLDVQNAEQADRIYGSEGARLQPPQPYMELCSLRLYSLLHGQSFSFEGYSIYFLAVHGYDVVASSAAGRVDVHAGHLFKVRIT